MEQKNEKQPSLLKQLFVFAGNYKYLSILSVFFAGISALAALVPFYCICWIMHEVLRVKPDFIPSSPDSDHHFNEVCLCRRTTVSVKRCPHLLHVPAGCVRNVRSQVALQDLSVVISADTQCKRMDEILSCQKQAGKSTMDNKGYDITFGIAD